MLVLAFSTSLTVLRAWPLYPVVRKLQIALISVVRRNINSAQRHGSVHILTEQCDASLCSQASSSAAADFVLKSGENDVFSNQWDLGASGDLDCAARSHFKNKFPSILERCSAVELQKCFVGCSTGMGR